MGKADATGLYAEKPPRLSTLAWQRLVLLAMTSAASTLQALPRSAALRFGTGLGRLGHRIAGSKRRRAIANLHLAYGDAGFSPTERNQITRGVFEHFGRSLVAFLCAPKLTPATLSDLVTCDGWEHVAGAQAKGKGVVFVSAHLGNWEVLGRWLALVQKVPMTVVAKDPKQPAFAAYLRRIREGAGFAVLSKGESARDLLRVLRKGEAIFLMPDQNSGDVFVPFFGVPCGTVAGPASLALHTGAALIPIYCVEEGNGYRVLCLPEIKVENPSGGEVEVARLMGEVNTVLERMVRHYPTQWLWLHNRWKSAFDEKNHARAWQSEVEFGTARERWVGIRTNG